METAATGPMALSLELPVTAYIKGGIKHEYLTLADSGMQRLPMVKPAIKSPLNLFYVYVLAHSSMGSNPFMANCFFLIWVDL